LCELLPWWEAFDEALAFEPDRLRYWRLPVNPPTTMTTSAMAMMNQMNTTASNPERRKCSPEAGAGVHEDEY